MDLPCISPPKVCFFDSGIGGLTLLYKAFCKLPKAEFYYFADNYNVPYGNLNYKELEKAVNLIFSEIAKIKPAAVVIACNTVTAKCAEHLRRKYDFPIVGIQPAIKEAVTYGGKCVVLATPATVGSASLKNLIVKYGNNSTEAVACPEIAAFIEQNIFNLDGKDLEKLLPEIAADTVVLGCTHYIFVKEIIQKKYGCPVFTGVRGTINRLLQILGADGELQEQPENHVIHFAGGDEEKNRRVFYDVLYRNKCGEIFPNKSQKIPKKG